MARRDEEFLWGIAHNPGLVERMDSNSLTIREHSTLLGMLRRWPQFERRMRTESWDGAERRSSRISGPHHV